MKNKMIMYAIVSCFVFVSCKKETNTTTKSTEAPLQEDCYLAVFEKDTVNLKINTLKDGTISGTMTMNEFENPIREGAIEGKFHGDTLFVDYTYKAGTTDKTNYKNPLALLKKGNELILGNGKIETYLGKTYFVKNSPIDFEKVKYKFSKVDCVK